MKNKRRGKFVLGIMTVLFFLAFLPCTSYAVPMTMNYQGYLTDSNGDPVDGTVDITFKIYSVSSGGSHLWAETHNSVEVDDGIFNVILTGLTTTILDGDRWLGIEVESDGEMTPRKKLTSVAFAIRAGLAESVADGTVNTDSLANNAVTGSKIATSTISSTNLGSNAITEEKIASNAVTAAKMADNSIGSNEIQDGSVSSSDVSFNYAGSSSKGGPASSLSCSGCVSQSELDFTAGDITSVNTAGTSGLTGGTAAGDVNLAVNFAGTGAASTVSRSDHIHDARYYTETELNTGGGGGQVHWNNLTAVPAGLSDGDDNTTYTAGSGLDLTGTQFTVTGAPWSGLTGVPAGFWDGVDDTGAASWELAGNAGTTAGTNFIGTTDNQALEFKVNSTRVLRFEPDVTSPNVIGGSSGNDVSTGVYGATISGGGYNYDTTPFDGTPDINTITGNYGTVGGGVQSIAGGDYAVVSGGMANSTGADAATVAGGQKNEATGENSTVSGGDTNVAGGVGATVGGGRINDAGSDYATVGGGYSNNAGGGHATVGGGYDNTASNSTATVGGGNTNTASGEYSTVCGGNENTASYSEATVGGGAFNEATAVGDTVCGGHNNTASGGTSTVSGGINNDATGQYAMVPGGQNNVAQGAYSFAAGRGARAYHDGTFVWGDGSTSSVFGTLGANQFIVRAAGGIWLGTHSTPSFPAGRFVNTSTGGYLSTGGAWTDSSDRNKKENFSSVDGREVLEKLARVPVTTWNYKAEEPSVRHIGPMAQDLYEAFGLGDSDKAIASIDAGGISFAGIQELYKMLEKKEARIKELENRISRLEMFMASYIKDNSLKLAKID